MDHDTAHILLVLAGVSVSVLGSYTAATLSHASSWSLRGHGLAPGEVAFAAIIWPVSLLLTLGTWVSRAAWALFDLLSGGSPPDEGGDS